jgi:NAD(P)-dependent dehydrogenase (short-subunit alcohol dehydrogenase family)
MTVPAAEWRDPLELAQPAGPEVSPTLKAAGVAYSNSKLAILYYVHELQRHAPKGINVAVFEPGFMPGTGLSRRHRPGVPPSRTIPTGSADCGTPQRSFYGRRRRPTARVPVLDVSCPRTVPTLCPCWRRRRWR